MSTSYAFSPYMKMTILPDEEIIERELTQEIQPWSDQVYQLLQEQSPQIIESDPQLLKKSRRIIVSVQNQHPP